MRPGRGVFASGLPAFSAASEDIRQNFSHGPGRLLLGRRRDMGVGVQGEPCREVAQHPGHRLDVHPVLKGQGCERVPEIVEPDPRQSRPLQHPVEHVEDTAQRDGPAEGRQEHPGAAITFLSLLFQNLNGVLCQR